MTASGTPATRARGDIQALRGFAVLAVLLQHIHPGLVHAGWLGVDVFFVVSGFVIAGLVARDVDAGVFSFRAFYARRAQRLLPAALVVFALTAAGAVFFLDAREWDDFAAQLAGAVTWTANLVLWQQTGYFEGAAQLKPLLHVWSLSVEEQFYLVLPALIVFAPKRWRVPGTVVAGAASLALYLLWMRTRPEAAFYLLPSRVWELALGVFAAFVVRDARVRAVARWCAAPALVALCAVTLIATGLSSAASAMVACVATMVVLLARFEGTDRFAPLRGLARVGDMSYSLYLVHWPIFAFLHNVQAGDPDASSSSLVLAAATVAALVLGWMLYRTVERPMRHVHIGHPRRAIAVALTASAVLAIAPLAIAARAQDAATAAGTDYVALRRDNLGFGAQCEFFTAFEPIDACRNSAQPALLVWGDSFAMHVVPGLVAGGEVGIVQATKSSCGPFIGIAQYTDTFPRTYAEHCLSFNRSVLDWLRATPSVRVVALSSAFYPYFDPARHLLRDGADAAVVPSEAFALQAFADTIRAIRATGRRVVVIAPPPSTGFDFTHCLERRARGRTLFAGRGDCSMDEAEYRERKAGVLAFLAKVEREAQVPVIAFDALLCRDGRCATELDGTAVYRDEGHLSYAGAQLVGRRLDLAARVMREAR